MSEEDVKPAPEETVSTAPVVPDTSGTKTVIVGQSKPLLNYVTACITMFNSGAEHVVLRARGEAINMAVEVAQMLKKRFMSNVEISNITIDGENVTSRDGRQLNLPVLEIELSIPK